MIVKRRSKSKRGSRSGGGLRVRLSAGSGSGRQPSRGGAAKSIRRASSAKRLKIPVLRARDLMTRGPVTVPEHMKVGALCDLLQEMNINGAPVVDERGRLVGMVTQEDIIYGAMGHPDTVDNGASSAAHGHTTDGEPRAIRPAPVGRPGKSSKRVVEMLRRRPLAEVPLAPLRPGEKPFWAEDRPPDPMEMPVGTIMTSPAISAEEDTPVTDLCRIMWSLRIHRVPILRKGKVTGLVSSMDLCRGVLEGKIRI